MTSERLIPTDEDRAYAADLMRVDEDLSRILDRADRSRLRGGAIHRQLGRLLDLLDSLDRQHRLDFPDVNGCRPMSVVVIAESRAVYDAYDQAEKAERGGRR